MAGNDQTPGQSKTSTDTTLSEQGIAVRRTASHPSGWVLFLGQPGNHHRTD